MCVKDKAMKTFSALARAKINLFLHVLDRRADGYHTLDSLVAFAETGDRVSAEPSTMLSLSMEGPFAISLDSGGDNLVLRAALALQDWAVAAGQDAPGAALHLDKRLPLASGIGGGSADAAAALEVLRQLWGLSIGTDELARVALSLGADVPVCIESRTRMMRGIGEVLEEAPALPPAWLLLVNPMRQVSTAAVFSALDLSARPAPPAMPDGFATAADLGAWLGAETRNDLEAPARRIAPEIDAVLGALGACDGVRLARMSGSGATCFALFDERAAALAAQDRLQPLHRDWWIEAAALSRG